MHKDTVRVVMGRVVVMGTPEGVVVVGRAWEAADGALVVELHALPLSGTLRVLPVGQGDMGQVRGVRKAVAS